MQILSYKDGDLKNILDHSSKLVTLIDLAGDHKFLKTTIYGYVLKFDWMTISSIFRLSGYAPDYCAILVNARIGWTEMTEEHLTIANALGIRSFIIINKIDLIKQADRIEKILLQIQTAIDRSQKRTQINHVLNEDEAVKSAHSIGQILPVFSVSNVTGMNLNLLTKFMNVLPNRNVMSAGSDTDASPLFYIDEIFNLPEVSSIYRKTSN